MTPRSDSGSLVLEGDLTIAEAPAIWKELRARAKEARGTLDVDLSRVSHIDGGVAALMVDLRNELSARGVKLELRGLDDRWKALFALFDGAKGKRTRRRPEGIVVDVGRATAAMIEEAKSILDFFGTLVLSLVHLVRHPRSGHWKEVPYLIEKGGTDGVPIVLVINFLVGFVMGYQSMKQLQSYGANVYVADLVGISVARELGPLMTAIVITGRSGAAFAAELGSMKVGEEIDALRTLGIRPFNWLVVPRVIALAIAGPILTAIADVVGIAGGAVVAVTSLGLSISGYINEVRTSVTPWDVESGLLKSVAFGITIALIGCQQGFSASGGAESVGRRTTSTVVTCLFAIVIIDTLFTMVFRVFEVGP